MTRRIKKGDLVWANESYLELREPWLYRALSDEYAGTVCVELVSPHDGPTFPIQGPYESWWFNLAAPAEFADAFLKVPHLWKELEPLFQDLFAKITILERMLKIG